MIHDMNFCKNTCILRVFVLYIQLGSPGADPINVKWLLFAAWGLVWLELGHVRD